MKYYLLPLVFISNAALACGNSSGPNLMDIAFFLLLGLISCSAFIIPVSILLLNKLISIKGLVFMLTCVLISSVISIVLMAQGSHDNYLKPAGISLLGIGLFFPYLFLAIQTIKSHRNTNGI